MYEWKHSDVFSVISDVVGNLSYTLIQQVFAYPSLILIPMHLLPETNLARRFAREQVCAYQKLNQVRTQT